MSAVSVHNLTRRFGEHVVLDRLNLNIAPGEFVALIGRSGSGKSTLLRTLCDLDREPASVVTTPARKVVVFQEHRLLPWKSVRANVGLGLGEADASERVDAALAEVGLASHAEAWPLTLSGGQAQRAALARALVRSPQLLLLDEPFAALDALTRIQMHELVLQLWQRHRPSVLLVTHDIGEAVTLADRVLLLDHGRIALDLAISEPRPRLHASPAIEEVRSRLLAALGLTAGSSVPAIPASEG